MKPRAHVERAKSEARAKMRARLTLLPDAFNTTEAADLLRLSTIRVRSYLNRAAGYGMLINTGSYAHCNGALNVVWRKTMYDPYANLTDEELLREARDDTNALVQALAKRLAEQLDKKEINNELED